MAAFSGGQRTDQGGVRSQPEGAWHPGARGPDSHTHDTEAAARRQWLGGCLRHAARRLKHAAIRGTWPRPRSSSCEPHNQVALGAAVQRRRRSQRQRRLPCARCLERHWPGRDHRDAPYAVRRDRLYRPCGACDAAATTTAGPVAAGLCATGGHGQASSRECRAAPSGPEAAHRDHAVARPSRADSGRGGRDVRLRSAASAASAADAAAPATAAAAAAVSGPTTAATSATAAASATAVASTTAIIAAAAAAASAARAAGARACTGSATGAGGGS